MKERHVLSAQEITDLVIGLRSLEWSLDPGEVDQVAERFGWKVVARDRGFVTLDVGFGLNVFRATNEYIDTFDRAVSRGL